MQLSCHNEVGLGRGNITIYSGWGRAGGGLSVIEFSLSNIFEAKWKTTNVSRIFKVLLH